MAWETGLLIPGRVIPKTQKMVLDAALLNTQYHKARIKCGAIQEKELLPPQCLGVVAYKNGALGSPEGTLYTFTDLH